MIVTGVLRHYATVLMATAPKPLPQPALKEQRSMLHGIAVRSNFHVLSAPSFKARREYLTQAYESGAFLKDPERRGQPPANPMSDPSAMDGMMGMMKNNMAMIIPNTLIMSWINAFFSGFVILKLPFPITIKFKSMLQAGVATKDMDPTWMSSISWYFLCYFGLQFVFNFLLGNENAASQMAQQMQGMAPQNPQMFGPGQDPDKQFLAEVENLAVIEHYSVMDTVEDRLLASVKL
jgi:ER membrane protein complex subunit 3